MIIRVFRVWIQPGNETEFEEKYRSISVPFMNSCEGMKAVSIGRPTEGDTDCYVMVSHWTSTNSLQASLGENWNEPHIPAGMEHLAEKCTVEHFEVM